MRIFPSPKNSIKWGPGVWLEGRKVYVDLINNDLYQDGFLKLIHLRIGMTYYFVIHTLKTQQNLAKYTKYAKEIVWFVNSWIRFNFSWNLLFGCWVLVIFCGEWSHKITIIATHHLLHLLQSWRTTFRSGRVSRIFHHRSFIHVMFLIFYWKKKHKRFQSFLRIDTT